MQARLRRLHADHEQVRALFTETHPHIRLLGTEGAPPDKYTFDLLLPGLVPSGSCRRGRTAACAARGIAWRFFFRSTTLVARRFAA
jgi:hypothetical protein